MQPIALQEIFQPVLLKHVSNSVIPFYNNNEYISGDKGNYVWILNVYAPEVLAPGETITDFIAGPVDINTTDKIDLLVKDYHPQFTAALRQRLPQVSELSKKCRCVLIIGTYYNNLGQHSTNVVVPLP